MSEETPKKTKTMQPRKKCDSRMPFPAAYVSFNPSLFEDPHWYVSPSPHPKTNTPHPGVDVYCLYIKYQCVYVYMLNNSVITQTSLG